MLLHEFWLEIRTARPTSAEEPAAGISLLLVATEAHDVETGSKPDALCDQLLDALIAKFREPDQQIQQWPELFAAVELRVVLPTEKTAPHLRPIKSYESQRIQKRYMPEWLNFQRDLVKRTLQMWLEAQVMPTEPFFKRVLPPVPLSVEPEADCPVRSDGTPLTNKYVTCQHCSTQFVTADDSEIANCPRCGKASIVHG